MIVSPSRLSSRESLEYDDETQFNVHPDPHSSETSPSSPSDINSHPHRSRRESRSRPPSAKRRSRSRPTTAGTETETSGTRTGDEPLPMHRNTHSHSHSSSSTRFLARLMAREDQDSKKMNSLLLITNEKLELETRRANEAENKAVELIRRFKDVVQSRDAALQDAARANEELRLYKVQLETAQREIFRAQEIIDRVASEKLDAEQDAARARTKARQLQEEKLVNNARDEGRRLGFQEGLSRGRRIGFQEGRELGLESRARGRIGEYIVNEDDILSPDPIVLPQSPVPESIEIRVASPPRRSKTPQPARPSSRNRSRSNTWDTALHAPTLPVPTVTTPLSVPSVSRAPNPARESNRTPVPVPIPVPPRSPDSISIRPRSVRNHISSPIPHHPSTIPRDGFIPETDRNSNFINVPPPHELSAPVPPSPTPSDREALPRPPPKDDRYATNVYDHAYPAGGPGVPVGFGTRTRTGSIGSRNSTRISQYDLVSPPRDEPNYHVPRDQDPRRTRIPGQEDDLSPTQRIAENWRSQNPDMVKSSSSRSRSNSAAANNQRGSGGGGALPPRWPAVPQVPQQQQKQQRQGSKSPFDILFRRNLQNRARTYSSPPEILIQPPSGSPSGDSLGTIVHPHLLTPDDANRELPLPGDEELNDFLEANENIQPPTPMAYRAPPPFILNDNRFPAGFVPLSGPASTTVMMAPRIDSPRFADLYGGMPLPIPAGLSYPKSKSSSGGSGGPTAFDVERSPPGRTASSSSEGGSAVSRFRRRLFSMGSAASPGALQRPFSIFSEDA